MATKDPTQRKTTMKQMKGPQFIRYFRPIIEVLKDLGGSGSVSEVSDLVVERMGITEQELAVQLPSGGSRVRNGVAWARLYLVKAGYISASQRGVWSLTEKGLQSSLTDADALPVFKQARRKIEEDRGTDSPMADESDVDDAASEVAVADQRPDTLLQVLLSLPAAGFERLCQRLLREAGFQQVTVTGRSGDGGLDGHGILQVNPLVSFKVLFQCKRYQGTVSPSVVRDFRGAMMGRADKGIILTTGSFTLDARREAVRDGVPPIELVDGEKLVQMFEELQLGLVPRTVFDIDLSFFDEFR